MSDKEILIVQVIGGHRITIRDDAYARLNLHKGDYVKIVLEKIDMKKED